MQSRQKTAGPKEWRLLLSTSLLRRPRHLLPRPPRHRRLRHLHRRHLHLRHHHRHRPRPRRRRLLHRRLHHGRRLLLLRRRRHPDPPPHPRFLASWRADQPAPLPAGWTSEAVWFSSYSCACFHSSRGFTPGAAAKYVHYASTAVLTTMRFLMLRTAAAPQPAAPSRERPADTVAARRASLTSSCTTETTRPFVLLVAAEQPSIQAPGAL